MTEGADKDRSSLVRREIAAAGLVTVLIGATVVLLFGPVRSMALTGDSYQWIQHAHLAAHQPALLLADLDNFYRPSATWVLVVDRLLWGGFNADGYRTTALVLHGLAAFLLWAAGRRLGLGWISSTAVALIWVAAPFTDESVFVVACSHQPLLLVPWLALIVLWPRSGESWSAGRVVAAAISIIGAAAAKETWVVTPALVAALEFERSKSIWATFIPTAIVGCVVGAYVACYLWAFQGSKPYLELGGHVLAKIPAQLAAFLYLEEPMTHEIPLTWLGLLAAAVMVAVMISCVEWRVTGSLIAVGLFLLPTLPTLMVPYMPQRYLAIPYAGFLLVIALWVGALIERFPKWRSSIRLVAAVTAILAMVAGATIVRADLQDHRSMAAAHAVLLEEAEAVAAVVAEGVPVAVIRDEQTMPLLEVVQSPAGFPKLVFVRNQDPYGLIDTAALFEWVLAEEGTRVEYVADWEAVCEGVPGMVFVHHDGAFENRGISSNLANEAQRWRASGRGLRVIRVRALEDHGSEISR